MRNFDELMKRYEVFKNSREGSGSELIDRDNILQRKRVRLERDLKQVDLEIIRNGHEMAATLWPIFLKEIKDEDVTELESES